MKFIFFIVSITSAFTVAQAQESVFLKYEQLAIGLATSVTIDNAGQSISVLAATNTRLQNMGAEIMDLYGIKYPECSVQYEDFKLKIPFLSGLSVDEIHAKYHDGDDLPSAPGYCYFGRALVVHPAMSAVRLADGNLSSDDVEAVKEESLEVAFHVKTVAKRLAK